MACECGIIMDGKLVFFMCADGGTYIADDQALSIYIFTPFDQGDE